MISASFSDTRTALGYIQTAEDESAQLQQRLASGKRINHTADDASGQAIQVTLTSQIRGYQTGQENIHSGIAFLQTADHATENVIDLLQRGREMALMSVSGQYNDQQRAQLDEEWTYLKQEIDRIGQTTEYNDIQVFQGTNLNSYLNTTSAISSSPTTSTPITSTPTTSTPTTSTGGSFLSNLLNSIFSLLFGGPSSPTPPPANPTTPSTPTTPTTPTSPTPSTPTTSSNNQEGILIQTNGNNGASNQIYLNFIEMSQNSLNLEESISSSGQAESSLNRIDKALESLNFFRAGWGGIQNRLESAYHVNTLQELNAQQTRSQIVDTDYAKTALEYVKANLKSSTGIALLAQTYQTKPNVLSLLR